MMFGRNLFLNHQAPQGKSSRLNFLSQLADQMIP